MSTMPQEFVRGMEMAGSYVRPSAGASQPQLDGLDIEGGNGNTESILSLIEQWEHMACRQNRRQKFNFDLPLQCETWARKLAPEPTACELVNPQRTCCPAFAPKDIGRGQPASF